MFVNISLYSTESLCEKVQTLKDVWQGEFREELSRVRKASMLLVVTRAEHHDEDEH